MRRVVLVIVALTMVSVFCGCGSSSDKNSSDDKSESKAVPIGVIDVNKESADRDVADDPVSEKPIASDESAAMLDQLQNYVESPEFENDIALPDTPEHDIDDSDMTLSQRNAVKTALNYIDLMAFSRQGLLDQMSSEYGDRYPKEDAEFAISYVEKNNMVDWDAEAVQCAQNYLDLMAFSRDGLIDQMSSESGDKFTRQQAEYAASQVGY